MENKEFIETVFDKKLSPDQEAFIRRFDSDEAAALVIGRPRMTEADKLLRLVIMGY